MINVVMNVCFLNVINLIESNGIPTAPPHALEKRLHVLHSRHEEYLFSKYIYIYELYLWRSLEQMQETLNLTYSIKKNCTE